MLLYYEGTETGTTYFAPGFVRNPTLAILSGWELNFNTATRCRPRHCIKTHHSQCFKGVLVKCVYEQQVWRLTGNTDSRGYFEGKWPD
jgi:hypothetical protein